MKRHKHPPSNQASYIQADKFWDIALFFVFTDMTAVRKVNCY